MSLSPSDAQYWTGRYEAGDIPWDAGAITTPLKTYIDQLKATDQKILIPGAGNAWEAEFLHRKGFTQVFVADISPVPLEALAARCPDFPEEHLLHGDFFKLSGPYDLILEQTFFCALEPVRREEYVRKVLELLRPGGRLVGVLFDDPLFTDHPPYGGNMTIYRELFLPHFIPRVMEHCHNSIPPRKDREIFIHLRKPV